MKDSNGVVVKGVVCHAELTRIESSHEDARAGHKPIVNRCDGPSSSNCKCRKVNFGRISKAPRLEPAPTCVRGRARERWDKYATLITLQLLHSPLRFLGCLLNNENFTVTRPFSSKFFL